MILPAIFGLSLCSSAILIGDESVYFSAFSVFQSDETTTVKV